MRRSVTYGLLGVFFLASGVGAQERVDMEMVAKIREEGLERSQVWATFSQLVDVFGPRLTASPAFNESARWVLEQFGKWGLSNAHFETWEFGRGWTLEKFSIEMIEPRYMPLIGYPRAWSPSTKGELVGEPLMLGGMSAEQIDRYERHLEGAIVMTRPVETRFIREDRRSPTDEPQDQDPGAVSSAQRAQRAAEQERLRQQRQQQGERRRALAAMLAEKGAGVALEPSRGEHGTVFVTGQGRDPDEEGVPTVVMAAEHYNMIARLLERGIAVKLSVNVQARFHEEDTNGYNVIAEIPGIDPRIGDEVVMMGAHLDSWHTAAGATDNADGSAVAIEAMRILATLGVQPHRTIRVALWGGEEQGLHGSRQYVERHLASEGNRQAWEKFSIYFNIDPGAGPIYGFFLEGNEAVRPFFEANLKPFEDLAATTLTMRGIGATDHLSFIRAGLPGFQPIHSYADYDVRTHHTNVDSYERINEEDLKQASVVMASLLYHAAMRDRKIPRGR